MRKIFSCLIILVLFFVMIPYCSVIADYSCSVTNSKVQLYADHITYSYGQNVTKYPGTNSSYSYAMPSNWSDPNLYAICGEIYTIYYRHGTSSTINEFSLDGLVTVQ